MFSNLTRCGLNGSIGGLQKSGFRLVSGEESLVMLRHCWSVTADVCVWSLVCDCGDTLLYSLIYHKRFTYDSVSKTLSVVYF